MPNLENSIANLSQDAHLPLVRNPGLLGTKTAIETAMLPEVLVLLAVHNCVSNLSHTNRKAEPPEFPTTTTKLQVCHLLNVRKLFSVRDSPARLGYPLKHNLVLQCRLRFTQQHLCL